MSDGVFKIIMSDLERLDKACLKNFFKYYFFPQGTVFPYQVWFRIMQRIKKNKLLKYSFGLVVYFIFRHYEFKYQIHLNSNIHVGCGLLIVHGSVYLNCSYIGDNFTVFQNVTLGTIPGGGYT